MATRFHDYNLDGESRLFFGSKEILSQQKLYEHMPVPEHRALKFHLAQIDKARLALVEQDCDETDEEFFDFGEEDFEERPSAFEDLYQRFTAWKEAHPKNEADNPKFEENKPTTEPTVTSPDAPVGE